MNEVELHYIAQALVLAYQKRTKSEIVSYGIPEKMAQIGSKLAFELKAMEVKGETFKNPM